MFDFWEEKFKAIIVVVFIGAILYGCVSDNAKFTEVAKACMQSGGSFEPHGDVPRCIKK